MNGIRKINRDMTLKRLLTEFAAHKAEGRSAISFHGRMGVSEYMVRQWRKRFPTFANAYSQAQDSERRRSFIGTPLGPKGAQ